MAAHGIDVYDFEFWNGPAPGFANNVVESHTRPGTNGVYQTLLGVKGEPFEVEVKHIFSTYLAAQQILFYWRLLVGSGPVQIKYNDVNYLGVYGHLYTVDRFVEGNAYALNGAIGPGYFYPFGGAATARLVLTPHAVN